jgi:hypothetical protein
MLLLLLLRVNSSPTNIHCLLVRMHAFVGFVICFTQVSQSGRGLQSKSRMRCVSHCRLSLPRFIRTEYKSSTKAKIERRRSRLYSNHQSSTEKQDNQGEEHRGKAKTPGHNREPAGTSGSRNIIGDRMVSKTFSYDSEPLPLSQAGHSGMDILRQCSFSFIKDAEGSTRVSSSTSAAFDHQEEERWGSPRQHSNHLYGVTCHDDHGASEETPSRRVYSSSSSVRPRVARQHVPAVTPQHFRTPGYHPWHPSSSGTPPPPRYDGYHSGASTWPDPHSTGRPREVAQLGNTAHYHSSRDVHSRDPRHYPTTSSSSNRYDTYTNHNS